jgi:ATP-dependent Clp protease ATP-binding subunit ClpB
MMIMMMTFVLKFSSAFCLPYAQVLDDGRLTDSQGRIVDFSNTIIVMTSNLGSQHSVGQTRDELRSAIDTAVRGSLRPELLNRIDAVVHFDPLQLAQIEQIAEARLVDARARLAEQSVALEWRASVSGVLARDGFDASFGARPMARTVHHRLLAPLSQVLLRGAVAAGDSIELAVAADADIDGYQPLGSDTGLVYRVVKHGAPIISNNRRSDVRDQ